MKNYKEKCAELSALYQEASITGRAIVRNAPATIGSISSPNLSSDLADWEISKEHELSKYIGLGLDMEFTNYSFATKVDTSIGKLLKIDCNADGNIFTKNSESIYGQCRLRENHIHWWNRDEDDPIPRKCIFSVFIMDGGWCEWAKSSSSNRFEWGTTPLIQQTILAFKVKYND